MAALATVAVTTILGTVLSTSIQEAMKEILGRIKDPNVTTCFKSLVKDMDELSNQCGDYHICYKDRSDNWRDKVTELKKLAYKIEDCIDRFKIEETTYKEFADNIERLKSSLDNRRQELLDYIRNSKGQASSSGSQGQRDEGIPDYGGVVGMEDPKIDLLKLITKSVTNLVEKQPMVISIVGSGGMGKSCLAGKVFDDTVVKNLFSLRAFACATGKQKDNVLLEILREIHRLGPGGGVPNLPGQNPHGHAMIAEELISGIQTHLSTTQGNERYIIVIDDVQGEELGDYVIDALAGVEKAVGIIMVTTTIHKVANSLGTRYGHVYKMRQLSVEESVHLFIRQHCRKHPRIPTPNPVKLNSMRIGKECDGVPVALISMARFWEGDDTRCKQAWSKFFDHDEKHKLEETRNVLDHSYNSLPSIDAETCLHYFSLFPRDYPVRRGSLLRRWMAEGAAATGYSATENLKTLIDRNVIWPVQVSIDENQDAKTCRPSRAMLGYISHKSKREGFVHRTVPSSEPCGATGSVRWLSIHQKGVADILKEATADVTGLRTLVVSSVKQKTSVKNKAKPPALSFDKCVLLRVLDLEAWQGAEQINLNGTICDKLKLLKYLSLGADAVGYVPQQITKLECLETLDVGKDKEVLVHVDVLKLPLLRHLLGKIRLRKSSELIFFPGRFTGKEMVTLAGFVTLTGNGFPQLMHNMSKLRKVKIFFDPSASFGSLSDRLAKSITSFLPETASPEDKGARRSMSIDLEDCEDQNGVLHSLDGASGILYSLKLRGGHILPQIPSFIAQLKDGISKLHLSYTSISWEAIVKGLSHFPVLKYLKLEAKDKFEDAAVQGQRALVLLIKAKQLKHLQRMCLQTAGNLPQIEIQGDALKNLVSLHLISGSVGFPSTVIYNSNNPPIYPSNEEIPPSLKSLKEVTLQSPQFCKNIKKTWYAAARSHDKNPQVLFLEHPPHA